ncbi:hypothetical protein, partial [Enterobacter asburiae]
GKVRPVTLRVATLITTNHRIYIMIFTKEPANKVFVFVTAYRGHESHEVNEKMLKGLIKTIRTYPGAYGNIRDEDVTGCREPTGS